MAAPHKRRPVLTIIAGPNGSGKTTMVSQLLRIGTLGILVNADDIAASLSRRKGEPASSLDTQWEAAVSAEEMRWALLDQGISFATETVMSDRLRWTRFIEAARLRGYRIVLYFITTVNPSINVKRVEARIRLGDMALMPPRSSPVIVG